jgi:hypothetical protein
MIGEGALPAALSKPFLLKIILMVGLRNATVACPAIFKFEMAVFGQNCKDQRTLDAMRWDWLEIGGEWMNRVNFGLFLDPGWTRGMDFTVGENRR